MRTKTNPNGLADKHAKEIKRRARRQFSAEDRAVPAGSTHKIDPNANQHSNFRNKPWRSDTTNTAPDCAAIISSRDKTSKQGNIELNGAAPVLSASRVPELQSPLYAHLSEKSGQEDLSVPNNALAPPPAKSGYGSDCFTPLAGHAAEMICDMTNLERVNNAAVTMLAPEPVS